MQAIGWGVLAEMPGQEIVLGVVTWPWEADVTFRALPAVDFTAWHEPGYAKIAVTLRVDAVGPAESIAQTATRVATTDAEARARFRRYWALFSAGIVLLRLIWRRQIKSAAEHRVARLRPRQPQAGGGLEPFAENPTLTYFEHVSDEADQATRPTR